VIEALLLLAALALVVACGAFVAAEFSFVTVDRATVQREAEAGDARSQGVLSALHGLSTQLSAAQVGITVTNLVIGFLAEPAIADLVPGPREVSLTVAIILATAVTMIFGELVPKNLAIARPLATARAVQGFQRGFTRVFGPVVTVLNGTANKLLRRIGVEPQEELASARSPQELTSLVRRSAEQGTLEEATAMLLQRSLAFGDRRAGDVMTPRERMHALHDEDPVIAVMRLARETGRSRFPVLRADGEAVEGIVHVKHAMGVPYERRDRVPVREVMVEPVLVPDTVELDPLLVQLRQGGLQMAVVVNEFGGFDGIVTLEDLIEEIVGEVRDEHDGQDDRARRLRDGSWLLSGLLRPDEVERIAGIMLPEDEDYETVAGLVAKELGRVPEDGDRVEVEGTDGERERHHVVLEVTEMDDLRVDRVRMTSEPIADDDEEDAA
jgi:CBS domain containing-hemolysin-like protein